MSYDTQDICYTPIGYVESPVTDAVDTGWGATECRVVLRDELAAGLTGLDGFSHVLVVYALHKAHFDAEKHLVRRPQNRPQLAPVGIFAQRAKNRPCPIGITAARLLFVEGNALHLQGLDAVNGTPVLDIKPYYPQYDCREDATTPSWVDVLMEHYF